jgi:hypothetical protein
MSNSELPEHENESTGFDVVDDDDLETYSMPTHRPRMPMHPPGPMDWHSHPHAHRRGKRVPRMLIAFLLGLLIGRMLT